MKNSTNDQDEKLFEFLIEEGSKPFSGWDFSYICDTGRMVESPLTWSYTSKILMKLRNVNSLLDMGTGGGEFLSLLKPLPEFTCATEAYKPNVLIAKQNLEHLGVKVFEIKDDHELPFDNNHFEMIINKHEAYCAKEVFRILRPECQFITQQIGGINDIELNKLLGAKEDFGMTYWNLEYAVNELKKVGFKIIEQKEYFPSTRFFDVGAIIYYLKAIPWQIPDFTIEKYFEGLNKIHNVIQEEGYIDIKSHRFFIVSQK